MLRTYEKACVRSVCLAAVLHACGGLSPDNMARVSLANLDAKDYAEIARRMFELLDEYKAGPFLKQGK